MNVKEIEFIFPEMHISRSAITKGDLVPLHTHSGKYGFVYILQGRCKIVNYFIDREENELFHLTLVEDKEYSDHEYTIISGKNNVHSILALEDSLILDAFSEKPSDGHIQQFLKVIEKVDGDKQVIAKKISVAEADIPKHLLEKTIEQVLIE